MLKRFVHLKEFLPKLEMDEIDDLILTTSEIRKIEALCARFEHVDSVTKALHSDNVNLAEARAFFDTVIEEYPETMIPTVWACQQLLFISQTLSLES